MREHLADEAEALLARRFAIIQVWRAINQPIEANPLALADANIATGISSWRSATTRIEWARLTD